MRHWREISVPDGWRFEKAQQGEEISSVDGYCAWYVTSSSERGLKICATKGIRIWFGAGESAWHNGTSVDETRIVAGCPASVIYSTRDPYFPLTLWVYDAATQVEYTIYGHYKSVRGANVDAVLAIAESLFSPTRPFGPSQSASPTSSSVRGTAQALATIEINVFAGATVGEKEITTRGWHGPPYGNDNNSQLDDGALDWHVGQGNAVHLRAETKRFIPATPLDHIVGRVEAISSTVGQRPSTGCARADVDVVRHDGVRETVLGRLYYWHAIPEVSLGEVFAISGSEPVAHRLGTVAASPGRLR